MEKTGLFLFLFLGVAVLGCENHDLNPVPIEGNYLPVELNAKYYLREQFTDTEFLNRVYQDTMRVQFAGDTVIANKTYHRFDRYSFWDSGNGIVEGRDYYHFFRKEGSRYLEPASYPQGEELVFLDTQKPVGSSWTYYVGYEKELKVTYTIKAVNARREINGALYENVIEVETESRSRGIESEEYDFLVGRTQRYFAKDRGEIYSSSGWFGYTGGLRLSELPGN